MEKFPHCNSHNGNAKVLQAASIFCGPAAFCEIIAGSRNLNAVIFAAKIYLNRIRGAAFADIKFIWT